MYLILHAHLRVTQLARRGGAPFGHMGVAGGRHDPSTMARPAAEQPQQIAVAQGTLHEKVIARRHRLFVHKHINAPGRMKCLSLSKRMLNKREAGVGLFYSSQTATTASRRCNLESKVGT